MWGVNLISRDSLQVPGQYRPSYCFLPYPDLASCPLGPDSNGRAGVIKWLCYCFPFTKPATPVVHPPHWGLLWGLTGCQFQPEDDRRRRPVLPWRDTAFLLKACLYEPTRTHRMALQHSTESLQQLCGMCSVLSHFDVASNLDTSLVKEQTNESHSWMTIGGTGVSCVKTPTYRCFWYIFMLSYSHKLEEWLLAVISIEGRTRRPSQWHIQPVDINRCPPTCTCTLTVRSVSFWELLNISYLCPPFSQSLKS